MKSTSDIIVIGGGIIGCSIAYELAGAGLEVVVIDKGRPGQEASHAAAGMLAPHADAFHALPEPLTELCHASLAIYPDYVAKLEEETGIKIGYQTSGSICLATDFKEAQLLAGLLERQVNAGRQAEELSARDLGELLPGIAETIEMGVYLPGDHFVNNRQLMTALITACHRRDIQFRTGTPVTGLTYERDKATGVRIPGSSVSGGKVIIAAGCWSGLVEGTGQIVVPVRPVRGQIILLDKQPQPMRHLVHSSGCYLVPWPDGRILVGSTLESVGYNKEVTAAGIGQLLTAALQIIPALASASIREIWAGLRPGTPDDLPILGSSEKGNLFIASGHFRNGILLAPITAKLMTEFVVSAQPSTVSLTPFRPRRFAG